MSDDGPTRWGPRQQFIVFQTVVWSFLAVLPTLPAFMVPVASWSRVFAWLASSMVMGIVASTLLATVLVRLPERVLRGLSLGPVIVLGSMAASLIWSLGGLALEAVVGRDPLAPFDVSSQKHFFFGWVRGTFLLALWSGGFLTNLLSNRVQRAREHLVKSQALADRAQLQVLRSQINPHFLFNALNSVIALITENPAVAKTMVRDISTLLRRALDADSRRDTTVQQELEFVQLYLKCEGVRFEQRLQVSFDIEASVRALAMPPMLLHPLVENAIKHGMRESAMQLKISARRAGDSVELEVANVGVLNARRDEMLPVSTGIGLQNVSGRLGHLFPGQHAFELIERDGWVVAKMSIPARASRVN